MLDAIRVIIAPVTFLLGILIALYVKDNARAAANAVLSEQLKGLFASFKIELMDSLDKTYRRSSECTLMMDPIQDRLDIIDIRLDKIEGTINGGCPLLEKKHASGS